MTITVDFSINILVLEWKKIINIMSSLVIMGLLFAAVLAFKKGITTTSQNKFNEYAYCVSL